MQAKPLSTRTHARPIDSIKEASSQDGAPLRLLHPAGRLRRGASCGFVGGAAPAPEGLFLRVSHTRTCARTFDSPSFKTRRWRRPTPTPRPCAGQTRRRARTRSSLRPSRPPKPPATASTGAAGKTMCVGVDVGVRVGASGVMLLVLLLTRPFSFTFWSKHSYDAQANGKIRFGLVRLHVVPSLACFDRPTDSCFSLDAFVNDTPQPSVAAGRTRRTPSAASSASRNRPPWRKTSTSRSPPSSCSRYIHTHTCSASTPLVRLRVCLGAHDHIQTPATPHHTIPEPHIHSWRSARSRPTTVSSRSRA